MCFQSLDEDIVALKLENVELKNRVQKLEELVERLLKHAECQRIESFDRFERISRED